MIFNSCQNNETIGLGTISFSWFGFHVDFILLLAVCTTHYKTTDTTTEAYNLGANQVGEMFANYNCGISCIFFATNTANIQTEIYSFRRFSLWRIGINFNILHSRTNQWNGCQ
jgi:hypothetical protein